MAKPVVHAFALEQYRKRADIYDLQLLAFEPVRADAIARLALRPGATVLDVGCGTGLSFEQLQQAVGPRGHIIGVEQCPEMLAKARTRVATHAWTNVALLNTPVESATIARKADAALFHFTHDILREADAVDNVLRSLKPGATVVAAGLQWAAPWAWATNLLVMAAAMHSVSSLDGLGRPWSLLEQRIGSMVVHDSVLGGVFIASGVVPGRVPKRASTQRSSG